MSDFFVVSIDFDGVLAQGLAVKLKYAKKWFGVDLALGQTKEKGFENLMKSLGKTVSYRDLMGPLNEQHIMEYQVPSDCIPVLSRLFRDNFRFVIITSRNAHDYPYAKVFIKNKFGELIEYSHRTGKDDKGEFIGKIKPRVHVDDDLKKLVLLEKFPIELVYYRQPENQAINLPSSLRDRIREVSSFEELEIVLRGMRCVHEGVALREGIKDVWTNVPRIFAAVRSLPMLEREKLERGF